MPVVLKRIGSTQETQRYIYIYTISFFLMSVKDHVHIQQPKQEVQQQAPITHPLFGVEPQHVPLNPQFPQYPAQQFPGQFQQYPAQYDQYQGQYAPGMQYPQQVSPRYLLFKDHIETLAALL